MSTTAAVASQDLQDLHNTHMTSLDTDAMMEYLMSSMDVMKRGDILEWKKTYRPDLIQQKVYKTKKRKALASIELNKKTTCCVHCQGYLLMIEDGMVCIECGVVDLTATVRNEGEYHNYADRVAVRVKVHRYERLVHFKDYMSILCATKNIAILPGDLARLRVHVDGKDYQLSTIEKALKKEGLSKQYKKLRYCLLAKLSDWKPIVIDASDYYELLRLFCRVEWVWKFHHNEIAPSRKVFLSYPFVFSKLAAMLPTPNDYTRDVQLLKSKKLLAIHEGYWKKVLLFF